MGQLMGQIGKLLFYALAALVIGWTSVHTYDVLYKTNPIPGNEILAVWGLIVFEGGMLIWYIMFKKNADGLGQHAVSLIGTVCGLGLVVAAFALDNLMTPAQLQSYDSVARWATIFATGLTVMLIFLYELLEPKTWAEIQEHIHVAMIEQRADKLAEQMIEKDAQELAQKIANNRRDRAFANAEIKGIKKVPQTGDPSGRFGQTQQPSVRPVGMTTDRPGVYHFVGNGHSQNGEENHKGGDESPSR